MQRVLQEKENHQPKTKACIREETPHAQDWR